MMMVHGMGARAGRSRARLATAGAVGLAALLAASSVLAQAPGMAPGAGQGGLSPDTPVLAPTPPGPGVENRPGPKNPLPPRDAPRAPQPGQSVEGRSDGPKNPLPPRDAPRAPQPGNQSASVKDADWPCVQVKVASLSYGQMWGGPPLEDAFRTWRDDEEVADLAATLAARRTTMDEVRAALDKFVKRAGDEADKELSRLFAGVFDEINQQRTQIVNGIERYARKQRDLSEQIKARSLKMAESQKSMAEQISPEAQKEQEALNWDTRIYDERAKALNYVCESPVILEQRAFDIGREIQSRLSQNAQ